MGIPNLKRITINSEQELDTWLTRNFNQKESTLLVTHTKASHRQFVSRDQVGKLLAKHHWQAGPRYTIGSDLLGHVIFKVVP